MKEGNLSMVDLVLGMYVRAMWPLPRPSMRMVGEIVEIKRTSDFLSSSVFIKFDDNHKPHEVLVAGTQIVEVDRSERSCWQMKVPKGKPRRLN